MAFKNLKQRDWPGFGKSLLTILNQGYPPDEDEDDEPEVPLKLTSTAYRKLLDAEIEYDPEAVALMDDPGARLACRDWLQRFASTWLEVGHTVKGWEFKSDMEAKLSRRTAVLIAGKPAGQPPTVYLETPSSEDPAESGHSVAVWLFFKFMTSPLFDRLERCSKCGEFYLAKRRQARRQYCSAKCGRKVTAERRMHKLREDEYRLKLRECRRAFVVIHGLPSKKRSAEVAGGWKAAVARRAGPEVTQHFVTRAVNEGKLTVPAWLKAMLEK